MGFTSKQLLAAGVLSLLLPASSSWAASPPALVNYQGVLRGADGSPLDGDFDMVFRFLSSETAGDEILIDRHTADDSSQVTVNGGLFSAWLGGGAAQDGTGPGTYLSVAEVLRDYSDVWVQVEVGGEVLDPRVRLVSAGYALNAAHLDGRPPEEFIDTSATPQTKNGRLIVSVPDPGEYGIEVSGVEGGGYFEDADQSGYAQIARQDVGVRGYGTLAGGYFNDPAAGGYAWVGRGSLGIQGHGGTAGAYFEDVNDSGYAYIGNGDFGVRGWGDTAGGYFADDNGTGQAWIGSGNYGMDARGTAAGGYFQDSDGTGKAWIGYGTAGGYFWNSGGTGDAWVGAGDNGILAAGTQGGAFFEDSDSGGDAWVGYGSYKILGTGAVSFVQNHPEDGEKVIVYAAPEASEVAVYTRGSARLQDGLARIELDPTFAWVANPDLGLTAHLTVRDELCPLMAESVSTTELVVRGPDGSGARFDYIVYGLRIGFEELPPVQPKQREARIPSMNDHNEAYRVEPELRVFNALERFRATEAHLEGANEVDLSRADALVGAIGQFDPAIHASSLETMVTTDEGPGRPIEDR